MLVADLNVDLCAPAPDLRTRQVADFLAANDMEDMLQTLPLQKEVPTPKDLVPEKVQP